MIVLDVNLLLFAQNEDAPEHSRAVGWLEHNAQLASADHEFVRFVELKWINPLA